jgi:hypothetical protein
MKGNEKLVEEDNEETNSECYDSDFDAEDGDGDILQLMLINKSMIIMRHWRL